MENLKQEFKSLSKKLRMVFLAVLTVGILSLISTAVLAEKLQKASDPALAAQEEIQKVVAEVGRFIILPDDETPTMATVSDPSKLSGQPFFENAEAGDKVLIYTISRKAILWRPSTKKIIEVASINVTSPAQ
ncbi:hypothetical protein KW796_01475 [Candidatus Parcubacteria bacterium]|nr:hypothetical protein [Candidatus Parcubacteria bacterium]